MEHSVVFPPSTAFRGIICPASVHLQDDIEITEAMSEGSAIHNMSELHLKKNVTLKGYLGNKVMFDGRTIKITQEMIDVAEFYCSEVKQIQSEYPDAEFLVEHRVDLGCYGYPDVFGTADVVINDLFNVLIVMDLKTGKGKSVPADADQLKMYAVMAAGDMIDTYERIITIVIQPRDLAGEKVKVAEHDPLELKKWMEETVIPAIEDSKSENPTFQASEEGCQWCGYKGKCKAQADHALAIAVKDFELADSIDHVLEDIYVSSPNEISNEMISKILGLSNFFENWLSSVRGTAVERMLKGQEIPNYKLVESITKRRWNPDVDVEHILYKELKIRKKDLYEPKLKTPNQVIELVKYNPKIQKRVEELIIKPEGNPTLALNSDRRTKLEHQEFSAEQDFANV